MKRIFLTEKQLNDILKEEEYTQREMVGSFTNEEDAVSCVERLRHEMGFTEYDCYNEGNKVFVEIEKDSLRPWYVGEVVKRAKETANQFNNASFWGSKRMVAETAPGFHFNYPQSAVRTFPKTTPQTNQTAAQPPVKNTVSRRREPDYDSVYLAKDPNVPNGKDYEKKGGNFPVVRNGRLYWTGRPICCSMFAFCKNAQGEWCVLANKRGPGADAKNPKPKTGLWNVPRGFMNSNENKISCAAREALEETGVKIPLNKIRLAGENDEPGKGVHDMKNITYQYTAILDGVTDDYPLSDQYAEVGEVLDIDWIPLSQIDTMKWAFSDNEKILRFAKVAFNFENGAENDNVAALISYLKKEISDRPYAQQLLDTILNKLNYVNGNNNENKELN